MTAEELLAELKTLSRSEKEKFYYQMMDGFYDTMMTNPKFMEEAFHSMAGYLNKMKHMGLDVNTILADMEASLGMKKAKAA